MTKTGPIVIIEDDMDDQDVLKNVFQNLSYKNEIIFFSRGDDAFKFLGKTDQTPFLILSDINLPGMDGFELRSRIWHSNHPMRDIPFIFYSTSSIKKTVREAYALCVQGFFTKPVHLKDWEDVIRKLIDYWSVCIPPNY